MQGAIAFASPLHQIELEEVPDARGYVANKSGASYVDIGVADFLGETLFVGALKPGSDLPTLAAVRSCARPASASPAKRSGWRRWL